MATPSPVIREEERRKRGIREKKGERRPLKKISGSAPGL